MMTMESVDHNVVNNGGRSSEIFTVGPDTMVKTHFSKFDIYRMGTLHIALNLIVKYGNI